MTDYILKSDSLVLTLSDSGAELISIYDYIQNIQYLWNGDPFYWKRHSPVLFPFVGSTRSKSYAFEGQTYPMSQHGFARDMIFSLVSRTENEAWFRLEANEETIKKYPFEFRLELGYRLTGRTIRVIWRVVNTGKAKMYFSIGGHPAFYCPLRQTKKQEDYYIAFDTEKPIRYLLTDENGLAVKKPHTLTTENGILPIGPHMFDNDAFIIEDHQCHKVSLLTPSKLPYVSVSFDAPLFGIWSPAKKNAPFVCIEPWYGRCDAADFTGTLKEREYENVLEAGAVFEAGYMIEIHETK